MIRTCKHAVVLGSLLAMSGCAHEDSTSRDEVSASAGLAVGDQVFPAVPTVTEYATWGKQKADAQPSRTTEADVTLAFKGRKGLRSDIEVEAGLREKSSRRAVTLSDGVPTIRPDLPAGAVDLFELLPEADTSLVLDVEYESPPPDLDYVLAEADQDRLVLWQQMKHAPSAVVPLGDKVFVRVEGRANNRLHYVDDDGSLGVADLGTAYLHVVDLVKIPGHGWQVLRFARLNEVEGAERDPFIDLGRARQRPHAAFVVCATRMDLVGRELAGLHEILVADVPEFSACLVR